MKGLSIAPAFYASQIFVLDNQSTFYDEAAFLLYRRTAQSHQLPVTIREKVQAQACVDDPHIKSDADAARLNPIGNK